MLFFPNGEKYQSEGQRPGKSVATIKTPEGV